MNGGGYIMRKKTVLGKWSTKPTSYDELFFFLYFSFVLFISTDNVRRQQPKLTADHHSGGTWCWSNNVLLWCLRAADCVESYLCEITPQWVYWMVIMITVTIYIYIYRSRFERYHTESINPYTPKCTYDMFTLYCIQNNIHQKTGKITPSSSLSK